MEEKFPNNPGYAKAYTLTMQTLYGPKEHQLTKEEYERLVKNLSKSTVATLPKDFKAHLTHAEEIKNLLQKSIGGNK